MKALKHRIFLSHNIRRSTALIVDMAQKVAADRQVDLVSLQAGPSSPAVSARQTLEENVEGLLAIFHEETGWISSEIGMAFAFRLPVFVIADNQLEVGGISPFVTRIRHTDIFDSERLRAAIEEGLSSLESEIDQRRAQLPEPPATERVEIIPWRMYYELIEEAARTVVAKDVSGAQQGFKPTLILGISRGGIIVADILSRQSGDIQLGLLDADRISVEDEVSYSDRPIRALLEDHLEALGRRKQARILIVDDVIKTGTSLEAAVDRVSAVLDDLHIDGQPPTRVKSLVLIRANCADPKISPDYSFLTVADGLAPLLPYGLG